MDPSTEPPSAFWHHLPAYSSIDPQTFLDHRWQAKHSITSVEHLAPLISSFVPDGFIEDVEAGLRKAPMNVRLTPYVISRIDWERAYADPLRRQFLPVASQQLPDHPKTELDPLHERENSPVPGLTHRYRGKALFLPLLTCPVYCRFCTRSYAVGTDTEEVEKERPEGDCASRWQAALDYVEQNPEIEDVVVSGGDTYLLRAEQIENIGQRVLSIRHVRRVRFGSKGLAILPQKILTDTAWTDAFCRLVDEGRKRHKEISLHTHFNHPSEITWITEQAANLLFERGVPVRNQTVLQAGVNDTPDVMIRLVHDLSDLNVHPYYVYILDMVPGVEDLRTTVGETRELEKAVRGTSAGYNTPMFVCDAPGGGGKRDIHSHDYYDPFMGIAAFTAPSVKPGKTFLYFDPLHRLPEAARRLWEDPKAVETAINDALSCG